MSWQNIFIPQNKQCVRFQNNTEKRKNEICLEAATQKLNKSRPTCELQAIVILILPYKEDGV